MTLLHGSCFHSLIENTAQTMLTSNECKGMEDTNSVRVFIDRSLAAKRVPAAIGV